MKTKIVYRCEFELLVGSLPGHNNQRSVKSGAGIASFENGFWVNDDYQFTQGSDAKYWIPPARILYVWKDTVTDE